MFYQLGCLVWPLGDLRCQVGGGGRLKGGGDCSEEKGRKEGLWEWVTRTGAVNGM